MEETRAIQRVKHRPKTMPNAPSHAMEVAASKHCGKGRRRRVETRRSLKQDAVAGGWLRRGWRVK